MTDDGATWRTRGFGDALRRARRSVWISRAVLVAVAFLATAIIIRLVGQVDWAAVWDALSHLTWWQPLVLLPVLLVRMILNALPLALYIPGVTIYRATVNDLAAHLMALIAPPPSDLALRVTMFSSWDVPASKGLAGTVMNTLTFYIVRFSTPALGFVLLGVAGEAPHARWLEVAFILASVAILLGVVLVMRSEGLAVRTGATAAGLAHRFRPSADPEVWADACRGFRADMAARFWRGFPISIVGLCGMLAADLAIIVLCLRFVGVSASEVPLLQVSIAYLFAYPLTVFPFSGIGIVDALMLAALVDAGGTEIEAAAVAALVVWRVFTIAGPVLLGAGAVAVWRRSVRGSEDGAVDQGTVPGVDRPRPGTR